MKMERFETEIKRRTQRRTTIRRRLIVGLVVVVIAGAVAAVVMQPASHQQTSQRGRFQRPADQAVPTLATTARVADVPIFLDGIGTTKALNTVTVSSQVDGKLIKIFFKEGQDV